MIQVSVICFNTLYLDIDFGFDFDYILISIDKSNSSLLKLYLWKPRALWLEDRGMGKPIQCSEKISFAVSDWTNDFSQT